MTKDQYYELCEMMGTEPVQEEIPVEFDDLPLDIQEIMFMYNTLQDMWDTMNGNYLGKSFVGIIQIMDMFDIHVLDRRAIYGYLREIDRIRSEAIKAAKPKQDTKPPL